jgi:hypothetical protein
MKQNMNEEIRASNEVANPQTENATASLQRLNQDQAILTLLELVQANGGGATAEPVLLEGLKISRGFAVGLKDTGLQVPLNEVGSLREELALEVLEIRMSAATGDRFIGLWEDEEDDVLCFEHSVIIESLEEALKLGRKEEQKYIFDFVNCQDIEVVF